MNRLPAVFVSHGAPDLLLGDHPARSFLSSAGRQIGRPAAILCVSAHWETSPARVTGATRPETVHDFFGFPEALYGMRYPAPGHPELASRVAALLEEKGIPACVDQTRGLDHGAWAPLKLMYPDADVPVIQLSVQPERDPAHHLAVGEALAPLRDEGVLLLGSGAATHNLRDIPGRALDSAPPPYVQAFHVWLRDRVGEGSTDDLVDYADSAPGARRNHPTPEHFLPLFVPLGSAAADPRGRLLHESFTYGVLSMAAFAWN